MTKAKFVKEFCLFTSQLELKYTTTELYFDFRWSNSKTLPLYFLESVVRKAKKITKLCTFNALVISEVKFERQTLRS